MSTDPSAALELLRLLTAGASTAEIRAVDADPEARDLALRIRVGLRRAPPPGGRADRAGRHRPRPRRAARPRRCPRRHRPPGPHPARHRRRLPHAVRRRSAGDTYMRATDGSVSARFQSVRLSLGRRARRARGLDPPAVLDRRLLRRRAVRAHRGDRHRRRRRGPRRDLRDPAAGRRPVRRGAVRRQPGPAPVLPRGGGAARARWPRSPRCRSCRPGPPRDTAEALERLSEAHDAVHRHTAGIERAAAAHDRFAELVLAGGGRRRHHRGAGRAAGGWVVAAGRDRSPAEPDRPGAGAAAGARGRPPRLGPAGPPARHVGRDGQGRAPSSSASS